jgi:tight adherence protein B
MTFEINPLYVFYVLAALAAVLAAEAFFLFFHNSKDYRRRVNRRLEIADRQGGDREKVLVQLRRERGLTADGEGLLPLAWFNRLLVQSGLKVSAWRAAVLIGGLGIAVFAAVLALRNDPALAGGAGVGAAVAGPFGLLLMRKRRQSAFAARFPDALDTIVRSLRAGHPVPVAISMVGRELPDPVGTEFGMVADEITYGADIETALRNMYERVGHDDLTLFVTSVAIQASSGGNLSQILDNLAKVIRERFKMRRKIKGLSAEGRVGAMIMNFTPLAVFLMINFIAPDFYGEVWERPSTRIVLGSAVFWMFVGNLIMRRMVNFKI